MAVITGGPGPDTLNDTPADDTISGLAGDDRIIISQGGNDTADGGADNDLLVIDYTGFTPVNNTTGPTPDGSGGFSGGFTDNSSRSVTYTGIERFDISTGNKADTITTGDGDDVIRLGDGDDTAFGGGGRDILRGGDDNDFLDGGTGADRMIGGEGDDIFIVETGGDSVEEAPGDGQDEVRSSISYTLTAHVEDLTLTGAGAINGTGNELANRINGNAAANILNGGLGADTLLGGDGDDTYIVDNAGDTVTENAGEGTDIVRSSVTFTLGANLERLILTGNSAINGTGNALANVIEGNAAANVIDGGAGADVMRGRGGNDLYFVDNVGDVIDENAGGGIDAVRSSVNYTLGAEVERLALTGTATEGNGNGLDNAITGNDLDNVLRGSGGNDLVEGRGGNDRLFGGTGADILAGQAGADVFDFDTALDPSTNVDTLSDFAPADDTIFLKNLIFTEAGPNGTLSADAFVVGTAAADADDRIVYDQAAGFIYYDADGAGGADAVLFARVPAGTVLTNADFVIYG